MVKKICVWSGALALTISTFAANSKAFDRADTNKDNLVSKEEYLKMRAGFKSGKEPCDRELSEKFFANKDKDKSGTLTPGEFANR